MRKCLVLVPSPRDGVFLLRIGTRDSWDIRVTPSRLENLKCSVSSFAGSIFGLYRRGTPILCSFRLYHGSSW